jgi:TRAP-type C4-dicarboxylate transport system substrate-binding protein
MREEEKMNKKRSRLLLISLCLFLLSMVLPELAQQPANAAAKPIKLTWLSFVPKTNVLTKNFQEMFIDKINERAKGELVIEFRGGPEVIAAFDQGKAVQQGVVDIALPPIGFYEAIAPGIGGAMLTQVTPDEERRPGGAYDYMVGLHKKGGLHYLGRGTYTKEDYFYIFSNKRIEKPKDFVGLKIGTATVTRPAVEAWGATIVSIAMPEYYSSMERGLVDALGSAPISAWYSQGVHEVTKYMIDHPYYQSTASMIMNLNKWNSLPDHLKKLITECAIQFENEYADVYEKQRAELKRKAKEAKVEIYKFSPDVAKWFIETAYNAAWEYQMKRFPAETPKLRELMTKKK